MRPEKVHVVSSERGKESDGFRGERGCKPPYAPPCKPPVLQCVFLDLHQLYSPVAGASPKRERGREAAKREDRIWHAASLLNPPLLHPCSSPFPAQFCPPTLFCSLPHPCCFLTCSSGSRNTDWCPESAATSCHLTVIGWGKWLHMTIPGRTGLCIKASDSKSNQKWEGLRRTLGIFRSDNNWKVPVNQPDRKNRKVHHIARTWLVTLFKVRDSLPYVRNRLGWLPQE